MVDIFHQSQTRGSLEGMAQMIFRHIQLGGNFADAVYGVIVLMDVAQGQRQFFLFLRQLDGTVGVPVPVQYGQNGGQIHECAAAFRLGIVRLNKGKDFPDLVEGVIVEGDDGGLEAFCQSADSLVREIFFQISGGKVDAGSGISVGIMALVEDVGRVEGHVPGGQLDELVLYYGTVVSLLEKIQLI